VGASRSADSGLTIFIIVIESSPRAIAFFEEWHNSTGPATALKAGFHGNLDSLAASNMMNGTI
jgi:hypothetical protein